MSIGHHIVKIRSKRSGVKYRDEDISRNNVRPGHNMIRTLPQNRPHTGVQKLLLNLFPCKAERGGTAEIDLFRSLLPDHHLGKHSLLTTDNLPDHAAYR